MSIDLPVQRTYLLLLVINFGIYGIKILHNSPFFFITRLIGYCPDNSVVTADIAIPELGMGVDKEVVTLDAPHYSLASL